MSVLATEFDIQIVLLKLTKHQKNRIDIQSNIGTRRLFQNFDLYTFFGHISIFPSDIKCTFIEHKTRLSGFYSYSQRLLLPALKTSIN